MTVVTAVFEARPERAAELENVLRELVGKVASEAGAVTYVLHRDRNAPNRFFFYERYRDQSAVDVHMATTYLKNVLDRVPELCVGSPVVGFYQPLRSIDELR